MRCAIDCPNRGRRELGRVAPLLVPAAVVLGKVGSHRGYWVCKQVENR